MAAKLMKILLGLSLFLSLNSWAYETQTNTSKSHSSTLKCFSLLNYQTYEEKKFKFNGRRNMKYYAASSASSIKHPQGHLAKYIFPGHPDSDKLIVVIDGVHSYIHYQGYRIDSRGRVERGKVKSFIQKDPVLVGSMAFIIQDLTEQTKSKLERLITQKTGYKALTCTSVTCNILRDVEVGVGKHWSTAGLAYSLMAASAKGKPVKIVSLNGKDPIENFMATEREEQNLLPDSIHYATLAAGAALIYSVSYFLF